MFFPREEAEIYRYLFQADTSFVAKLENKNRPGVLTHESDRILKELFGTEDIPEDVAQDVRDRYRVWLKINQPDFYHSLGTTQTFLT